MLADKTAFLADYALLSTENFLVELAKSLIKYPRYEKTPVTEIKNVHPKKTEYQINSHDRFFLDRRPTDLTGTYGTVNAAYEKVDDLKPTFGIKWFRRHNINPQDPDRDARREAKYNYFFTLRQRVMWFECNGRTGMRYVWQNGDLLSNTTNNELQRYSTEVRAKCLVMLTKEIKELHSFERCHRDLRLINAVIHLPTQQLHFIDLGNAKKVGRLYDDKQNYSDDLYGLLNVIKKLFPELNKKRKTIHHEAMFHLAQALSHKNSQYICTSAQAYEYCNAVAALPECGIKDARWAAAVLEVKEIADRTINTSVMSTDNLMRGSVRAATFQYK